MLQLNSYLENVSEELKTTRSKGSKVEENIRELVTDWIQENKATTIKAISEELNKSTQQIHQVLRKATSIKKVKYNKRTLVVLSEMV